MTADLITLCKNATLPWGALHDIGKDVRASVVTGIEGRDCMFVACALATRLRQSGLDARVGAGWGVWRFGTEASDAVGSVPGWMSADGHLAVELAADYAGHTWVEVDDLIVDATGFAVPEGVTSSDVSRAFEVMVFRKFPTTTETLRAVAKSRTAPTFAYLPDPNCFHFVAMMMAWMEPGVDVYAMQPDWAAVP